jgi:vitamin B12 transporter
MRPTPRPTRHRRADVPSLHDLPPRSERLPRTLLIGALLLALFAPGTEAVARAGADPTDAPPATGAAVGSLSTSDGLALPHVAIELGGPGGSIDVTTGPDGAFRVEGMRPGEWRVRVDAPGFDLSGRDTFVVSPSTETRIDLVLGPAPVSEQVVVSATRGEATLSNVGQAVSVIDRARIDERAAPSLLPLLDDVPGVATSRTGATGAQGSAFLRGGESRFARVLVDGVAVNQPGGAFDFGTVLPFELDRVEVTRGAASALYGTDALAGVIQIVTRRAREGEPPSLRGEAEAGSDDWQRYHATTTGAAGAFDWNAGVQWLGTDNREPNSRFEQTAAAATAGWRLDPSTEVRAVLRLDSSTVGTPGPTAYGRPDLDASFDRDDLVASVRVHRAGTRLSQEVQLGYARTSQLSRDPLDSGEWVPEWNRAQGAFALSDFPDPEGFLNRTARLVGSYEAELAAGRVHLLTAGAELEHETGEIGERAGELLRPERTNVGAYLQDRVLIGARAYLTLGARVERNGSFGTRLVPRAALAFRLREGADATTLRASAGLGIKEPSFLESYGESFFAKGNPDLEPEESATFDVGVEQRLLGSRLRVVATAFHHDYRDQIAYTVVDYDTFEGTYVNLAHTRARGLELEVEARPIRALQVFGQYTFLDGTILDSPSDFDPVYAVGQPLLRRPRNQASLGVHLGFERWSAGATLLRVGERADSDFVGLGLTRNPAYTRLDARLRVRVAGPLEAFVIGENLLDEQYEAVLGYPALGRTVRGGLRLAVGGRPR